MRVLVPSSHYRKSHKRLGFWQRDERMEEHSELLTHESRPVGYLPYRNCFNTQQLPGSNHMEASVSWRVAEIKLVSANCLKLILQTTVAANSLCGFLSLPLHQARSVLPDDLVVYSFLLQWLHSPFSACGVILHKRHQIWNKHQWLLSLLFQPTHLSTFNSITSHGLADRTWWCSVYLGCDLCLNSGSTSPNFPRCVWDLVCCAWYLQSTQASGHLPVGYQWPHISSHSYPSMLLVD